jgi:hypothetical protein
MTESPGGGAGGNAGEVEPGVKGKVETVGE